MHYNYDPDEWMVVVEHTPCRSCGGDTRKCNGACIGGMSCSTVRRPHEEVAHIKAERRVKEEDEILCRAAAILASRAVT